jgi:hypothetical protein
MGFIREKHRAIYGAKEGHLAKNSMWMGGGPKVAVCALLMLLN